MPPQGAKPPDGDGSTRIGPRDVALFYQACDDIQSSTYEICRMMEELNVDMDLSALTKETSRWLWDELQTVPPCSLPLVKHSVGEYSQLLTGLKCLIQSNSLDGCSRSQITQMTDFVGGFKRTLSYIRPSAGNRATSSSSIFSNSTNISISGGVFNATSGNVDPALRAHIGAIRRMQYVQLGVLFVSAGHKWQHTET